MLPAILKDYGLSVNGITYPGRVETLSPPKLTVKTIDHMAGGMDSPVKLDMGSEAMQASFTLSDYDPDVIARVGLLGTYTRVVFTGVLQQQGKPAYPMLIEMRGSINEMDPGDWKMGDKSTPKFMVDVMYLKVTINGRVTQEIDPQNCIRIINGVDQLADRRAILGI